VGGIPSKIKSVHIFFFNVQTHDPMPQQSDDGAGLGWWEGFIVEFEQTWMARGSKRLDDKGAVCSDN
jgi:hypothetical protein